MTGTQFLDIYMAMLSIAFIIFIIAMVKDGIKMVDEMNKKRK